jgi:NADH dehydrogenase FAD-containing subunit
VLTSDSALGPLDRAEQRESVSLAFLLLLERLTPPERGLTAANRIARQLRHTHVALVNARAQFVERVRLHQIAAGQQPRDYPHWVPAQPQYRAVDRRRVIGVGLTVWATGFVVAPLAAQAGLAVDRHRRILVDHTLRSHSHHDIYAVGDSAVAHRAGGQALRMACATGLPAGQCAADAITARLTGHAPSPLRFRYLFQCISLGRRDALIQFVHPDDSPREIVLTGRAAARFKELVVRGARWATQR